MSAHSRRRVLGAGAAGAAGAAVLGVGAAGGYLAAGSGGADTAAPGGRVVPFRGPRQAGVVTPAQNRLHFVALDVAGSGPALRRSLAELLPRWTAAAERMTAGAEAAPGGAVNRNPELPPSDTGGPSTCPRRR